jgi:hypothetical protein
MRRDPSSARHRGWFLAYAIVFWALFGVLGAYQGGRAFDWGLFLFSVTAVPVFFLCLGLVKRSVSHRAADALTGFSAPPILPATVTVPATGGAPIPGAVSALGFHYGPNRLAAIDWPGFVMSMAIRIEDALGQGFYAHGHECALLLSHADATQRIELAGLLRSYPADPTAAATQACVKLLDCAQMFKMQQLRQPWPRRPGRDDSSPLVTLARPRVELRDYELHMSFVDELGPLLTIPSLPWVEGHPEPDGPVRLG